MTKRKAEEPVRVPGNSPVAETRETHPAYGQLAFSRVQGSPGVLYGTHLAKHMGFIRMTLYSSERLHSLSHDWHMGQDILAEVELSYVQFAELITTMNQGTGIPCTIRKLPGNWDIPEIANMESEQKRVRSDFKERIEACANEANNGVDELEKILSKPSINKADREEIRKKFYAWQRMISSTAPFVLDQFQEGVERTATAAKAEVDGFITSAVNHAGLQALREQFGSPELPSGTSKEKVTHDKS